MEKLKTVISLAQAAKITGYNQDYLGFLVRKGEIKAQKVGRGWFTTEEEIKNFLFKQKIRHREYAIGDFFSRRRTKNIFALALITFIAFLSLGLYLLNQQNEKKADEIRVLSSDSEAVVDAKMFPQQPSK